MREAAIATVKAKYPEAYHTGHGTINQIVSHSNYNRRKQGIAEAPVIPLSDNLVISSTFDGATIEYLDTALWVQAAAVVTSKCEGYLKMRREL